MVLVTGVMVPFKMPFTMAGVGVEGEFKAVLEIVVLVSSIRRREKGVEHT